MPVCTYYQTRIALLRAATAKDKTELNQQLAKIKPFHADSAKLWPAYLATYLDPNKKIVGPTSNAMADYETFVNETIAQIQAGELTGAQTAITTTGHQTFNKLRDKLAKLSQIQKDVAKEEYLKSQSLFSQSLYILIGAILAAIAGGTVLALAIGRSITSPLEKIIAVMKELT